MMKLLLRLVKNTDASAFTHTSKYAAHSAGENVLNQRNIGSCLLWKVLYMFDIVLVSLTYLAAVLK